MKRTVATILAALALTGCFKKVSNDTTFIIKPNLQTVSSGPLTVAEGVTAYAYYDVGKEWSVASYEDAVARVITNTATGEKRQTPNAESQPYAENDPQGRISLKTTARHVLLVAVYEEGRMFAYMHYDTGENMPQTYLTMQFRTWKTESYTDSGWSVGMVPAETTFVLEPDLQSEENGAATVAEGVAAYAFYVNDEWVAASYADALATTITNTATSQTLNQPSVTAEPYAEGDAEGRLTMKTSSPQVMVLAIYEAGGMYAYRHFEIDGSVPQTDVTLQFRTWESAPYTLDGWSYGFAPAESGEESGEGTGEGSDTETGSGTGTDTGTDTGSGAAATSRR